ncbi:MAG: hypothetical protein COU46_01250 [Candidatus Niyogibacteria bacterium CG10_big_fil_rev_8_21_14_0_10_42_19]|uniref:DUF2238 domain-containing protein n=1 Tax=Candidatus Niyogibacteria bacterium CG10_big_fil_rev_8_21_14_0_10_42_19 TaxID=1974725 RepID=A0A2H0TG20_9BACT|nr:MAG: hypothetical protein COU46_01250 [Candidatus Niyogibacteria bacterium CG10_big_fil_rev_8_21_14_0_10_42_19]
MNDSIAKPKLKNGSDALLLAPAGMSLKFFLKSLLFFILFTHALAVFYNLYNLIGPLDVVLHFIGGFWLGASAFYFLYKMKPGWVSQPYIVSLLFIVGVSAIFGILWEFFEYASDQFFYFFHVTKMSLAQPGLADTLSDLFFDLMGGLLAALYFLRGKSKF